MKRASPPARWLPLLGLVLLGAVFGGDLAAWVAQAPAEGGDSKPPAGRREEEEEAPAKVPNKVIRVDEAPPAAVKPAPSAPADIDLPTAAARAKHPDVKQLFADLAVPHDVAYFKNFLEPTGDRPERARPLKDHLGTTPGRLKSSITLQTLDNDWQEAKKHTVEPNRLSRVVHYEEVAQERVKQFLALGRETLPESNARYLSKLEQLLAAEQALLAVTNYHDAARESEARRGVGWDDVGKGLRASLLDVLMQRLAIWVDKGDWEQALAVGRQAAARFPFEKDQARIAEAMSGLVQKALALGRGGTSEEKYAEVRRRLAALEREFPASRATDPLREQLVKDATKYLKEAEELFNNKRLKEARRPLEQAEEIYPSLPGLRELRQKLDSENPVLRIGVRRLPVRMSPALACTDDELQAVELMFEGLVELGLEDQGGRYRPALAQGRPRMIPLGRQFTLPRDAYWSNGQPITSADVTETIRMLRDEAWAARAPAWADDLFEGAPVTDPLRVPILLRQGHLEPLALMTFKVLPRNRLQKPDDEQFALKPIGSGPFRYAGTDSDQGRPFARFEANPHYRSRPGHEGLPRVRELRLFETREPFKDLEGGKLDLVLDLPSKDAEAAGKLPGVIVPPPMPTRRIHFLAVNHRRPALQSAALRRALLRAVPRERLLAECFRGPGDKAHRPLNGPYPAGSWACDAGLKADLYDLNLAKSQLAQAKASGVRLSLKYPAGDDAVVKAMTALKEHLEKELKLQIDLQDVDPFNLRRDVEEEHNYDLAYFHHDYADQTFWLQPLLDLRSIGPGGRNYLGCTSPSLVKLLSEAAGHRDFEQVRLITHTLHRQFVLEEVPFIPLWQLDRHVAVATVAQLYDGQRRLQLAPSTPLPLDPLRLFATVEYWRVDRKGLPGGD